MRSFSKLMTFWVFPALFSVAVLTAAAVYLRAATVEEDLVQRTAASLTADHPWASVTAVGRDLRLSGVAPSGEAITAAVDSVKSVHGVRVVEQAAQLPKVADPFVTTALLEPGQVTLTGNVSDDTMRSHILTLAAASLPDAQIDDSMEWARGATDGLLPLFAYGLAQLTGLTSGKIEVSGNTLSVSGQAATVEAYSNILAAFEGDLPADGIKGNVSIEPAPISPFLLSMEKRDGKLSISGYVPDEAFKGRLLTQATEVLPGIEVEELLVVASGAPQNLFEFAAFTMDQMASMAGSSALIVDNAISLHGTAAGVADYEELVAALQENLPSGATRGDIKIQPATVTPYGSSVRFDGATVTLEGFAPSEAARQNAEEAAMAALPDATVQNRLAIASGVPDGFDWPEATGFLIEQLPGFKTAKLAVVDRSLSVEGRAGTASGYDDLVNGFNGILPGGMTISSASVERVLVKPFVWSFAVPAEGPAVLDGFVPSEEELSANLALAGDVLPDGRELRNQQQIAAGAPDNFEEAVESAIRTLSRLGSGRTSIEDGTLTIEGKAPTGVAANEIRRQLVADLPPNFTARPMISVRKPGEKLVAEDCQQELDAQLDGRKIRFESGSAQLRAESTGLLDALAFIVRRCPQVRIEIAGHTDAEGPDVANQKLSEERAIAVRDYLVRSGVFSSRLVASGYGEAEPLADNSTEEGRSRNRRIEFRVVN